MSLRRKRKLMEPQRDQSWIDRSGEGGMMKLKIFSVAFYFVSFFLIDFPIKLIILKFPAVKVWLRKERKCLY